MILFMGARSWLKRILKLVRTLGEEDIGLRGFSLRPYQVRIVSEARELMKKGSKSLLIIAPTGSGKTCLTADMLLSAAEKQMPSLFIVHRRELVKQSTRTFSHVGVRHGIIAAGFPEDQDPYVQIASIGTLANRLTRIRKPRLIIWDECHHVAAKSWAKIHEAFPDAYHVGLTATPERLDGKGLGKWFNHMIHGPNVAGLIESGYLSKYRIFAPGGVSVDGIKKQMGEFARRDLQRAVDKPTITGSAIREYQRRANGKRAVVFCVSIEHSLHVESQFKAAGIRAQHVDGETDQAIRDQAIKDFEEGKIQVLLNVDLFGEGFDVPAIEAVIDIAPTNSLAKWLQRCGRALRPSPGKEHAIILDHAGNCERHGLPDEEREWSLDGSAFRKKDKDDTGPSVKVCPSCFAAQFAGNKSCLSCGLIFLSEARKVEQVEGELQEIDPAVLRQKRMAEQGGAQSLADLIEVGKRRGYKRPHLWAKHIFNARQAKKLQRRG